MKKASLFASAAAASVVLAAGPVFAQAGGGPFADVPTDHWAYTAVDRLQKDGIVIGYPDGTYGGKRAMTRYEFAVAIARLLDKIPDPAKEPVLPTDLIRKGDLEPYALKSDLAGLARREEVDTIRKLVDEFKNELTTLGVEVDAIKRRLDGLEGRLTALENEFKRVRIGGAFNVMSRGNHRRGNGVASVIDQDGYVVTGGAGTRGSLLADARVLHDVDLNVKARLSDTATAEAVLNFGNYLPFLNTISSFAGERSNNGIGTVSQSQEQTIYKLAIEAPLNLWGLGAVNLAVGRIPIQFTPYTLKLVDVDTYFHNDKTDLGDIPLDGIKSTFKIGPVGITSFAAKASPVKYVDDPFSPYGGGLFAGAGRAPFAGSGFVLPTKSLIDQGRPQDNLAMPIENIAGARATFGTGALGTIGVTYLAAGGRPTPSVGTGARTSYDRVFVWGADVNATFGGIGLTGAYTVSNTGTAAGLTGGDTNTVRDDDTFAWEAAANFNWGALNLGAGYKYVSPFFAAPGYWGKIGSWTNPVDIEGPFVRASYALGGNMALHGEGHFYKGTGEGALSDDDEIQNFRAGLKYGLTSASAVDLGVEWTKFDPVGGGGSPTQIFYNIGYGLNFNPTTSFKFLYQIVDYSAKGRQAFLNGGGPGAATPVGDGGVAAAQFSVKF